MVHIKNFMDKVEENTKNCEIAKEEIKELGKIVMAIFEGLCMQSALCNGESTGHKEIQTIGKRTIQRITFGDPVASTPKSSRAGVVKYQDKEFYKDEFIGMIAKLQANCMELIRTAGVFRIGGINGRKLLENLTRGMGSAGKKQREKAILPDLKKLHISTDEATSSAHLSIP